MSRPEGKILPINSESWTIFKNVSVVLSNTDIFFIVSCPEFFITRERVSLLSGEKYTGEIEYKTGTEILGTTLIFFSIGMSVFPIIETQ